MICFWALLSEADVEAYVSVSRRYVFIGRPVVESYLRAWLDSLQIEDAGVAFDFDTPSGGVEFAGGAIGGQMFLSDEVIAAELIRFAGLQQPLSHVSDWVELEFDAAVEDKCGVHNDGVYIQLSERVE